MTVASVWGPKPASIKRQMVLSLKKLPLTLMLIYFPVVGLIFVHVIVKLTFLPPLL